MKIVFKLVRPILSRLILFVDFITRKKPVKRSADEQEAINQACRMLSLYQFHGCPFCVKVRRVIHELDLPIELREVLKNDTYRAELLNEGKSSKVPCLRIDTDGNESGSQNKTVWLYESQKIIEYLQKRFG